MFDETSWQEILAVFLLLGRYSMFDGVICLMDKNSGAIFLAIWYHKKLLYLFYLLTL